jgi:hypothetical protein
MSGSDLATKADLGEAKAELKADLVDVEHRLETQIAAVRTDLVDVEHRLETQIAAVRADLAHQSTSFGAALAHQSTSFGAALAEVKAELKSDSRQMELRMTIKLGGMLAAGIAIVATVVRLIH